MDRPMPIYRIFPLVDAAITIDLEKGTDEAANSQVIAWFNHWSSDPLPGVSWRV